MTTSDDCTLLHGIAPDAIARVKCVAALARNET